MNRRRPTPVFPLATSLLALVFTLPLLAQSGSPRTIRADFSQIKGPMSQVFRESIAAGRANEGLRADWQEQLAVVQKEIGFKYIRMHGLLHDDMGVYREDAQGNPTYNWQYIDKLYDALLKLRLRPFVELGFMPRDLASGNRTVFWWKGNVTPPKSYEKWSALIRNLVQHFRQRYGEDEVRQWYFEVWNEPDISVFWSADLNEYLKLYKTTAEAVKSVSSQFRVGGPASAIPFRFEQELLTYCAQNHVAIDFISTHAYGVKEGYVDETGRKGTVLDGDPATVRSRMVHSREIIRQSAFPNLELHFTEWSSSYTPTDPMHDQYHQAAFILDKIKGAQESVNSMAYWVFTDIFEENGPRSTPFHGGFGLMNYQGIRKPAYHAFRFLSQLGSQELVTSDTASWATRNAAGDVAALFWDFTPIVPPAGTNDQTFYKKELPSKEKGPARLEIAQLPTGRYLVEVYRTGYRMNDPYTAYLDLGAPAQLTTPQEESLRKIADGSPAFRAIVSHPAGVFSREFAMRENDVVLVLLRKL
jgi:xylan 1,4-beta-xylosidase